MTPPSRPILVLLALSIAALSLVAGCNTARGFGRDVESAGEHIERAAR